jgi:hypothetical protein
MFGQNAPIALLDCDGAASVAIPTKVLMAILEVTKSLEPTKQGLRVKSTKSGPARCFAIPESVLEVLR